MSSRKLRSVEPRLAHHLRMSTDNFSQLFVYHLTATPDPDAEIGTTSYSIRIQVTFGGRKLMEFAPDVSDALIRHLGESGGRDGYDWSANNGEFSFRVTELGGPARPERMVEWVTASYGGGDKGAQHTYTPANASFATLLDDIAALYKSEEEPGALASEFSGGDVHQGRPLY